MTPSRSMTQTADAFGASSTEGKHHVHTIVNVIGVDEILINVCSKITRLRTFL